VCWVIKINNIGLVPEENGLLEIAEGKVAALADPVQLAAHNKKDVKARRIIVEIEQQIQMASAGLRFEDKMDGASNLCPWRERIGLVLEENGMLEIAKGKVVAPVDPIQLANHNKKDIKARRIIMGGVKDNIIPHVFEDNKGLVGGPSEVVPV
jgi:hypothetical protein